MRFNFSRSKLNETFFHWAAGELTVHLNMVTLVTRCRLFFFFDDFEDWDERITGTKLTARGRSIPDKQLHRQSVSPKTVRWGGLSKGHEKR